MKHLVGIDIIDNSRIKLDLNFLEKFLTLSELNMLNSFESIDRKIEFAAGRWAVKEAIIKVLEESNQVVMNKIEIGYENKKPILLNSDLKNIAISISHERLWSVAIASYIGE